MKKIDFLSNNKVLVAIGCSLIFLVLINGYVSSQSRTKTGTDPIEEDITTYIPRGFRLVPIKVENYKSLDQILGNYGTVDVYVKNLNSPKPSAKLLASNVRAIRSQGESSSIGLLVPQSEVRTVLAQSGPFTLTLNSSENTGTLFETAKPKLKKMRVYYSQ